MGIPELSLFFAKHLWFCKELLIGKISRHFTLLVHHKVRGDWRADVGRERNSEKMLGDKWPQTASLSNSVKGHGSIDNCMSLKIKLSLLKFSPIFYIWVSFVSLALSYFPVHSLLLPRQGEKEEEQEAGLMYLHTMICPLQMWCGVWGLSLIIHGRLEDLQGPQAPKKRASERTGLPETVIIPILSLIQTVTVQSFSVLLLSCFPFKSALPSQELCYS